jgi:pyruvate formate lyase activating enzyme
MNGPPTATIFDIQRFSVHDGPGIRTVVFFKGCGLSCVWCHNPEAVKRTPELAYYKERCLDGCRQCLDVCPEDALRQQRSDRVRFDRCTACGDCVDVCPANALTLVGREVTAQALLEEVRRDRPFYVATGGGITLSGGEPLLHGVFLQHFLPLAKRERLHVTMETGGSASFGVLEKILSWVDLVLFDLKVIDPARHERLTGATNARIHENLARLVGRQTPLVVRMPVVPGMNTDDENIAATAKLLERLGLHDIDLLRYNHLWEAKLPRLATERRPLGIRPPQPSFYEAMCQTFSRHGVRAHVVS